MIHTYSGYENKVKDTLEKSVENNGMQDLIFEVRVPMEEVVEIRNGKRVKSTRKVYPGYVLVHMIETSESWYVIHTYSGYENKVKDTLEKSVENNGMQDLILEVRVPMEEVVEIRNGKRVKSTRKVYPGYVLVHMIETSESWYVVRNTRGVTGFVGPDSKPVPLTQEEVDMMLNTEQTSIDFGFAIGEHVRILSGPLENFEGTVEDVDTVRGKLTVKVQMFLGREMPVEVDLDQVKKED